MGTITRPTPAAAAAAPSSSTLAFVEAGGADHGRYAGREQQFRVVEHRRRDAELQRRFGGRERQRLLHGGEAGRLAGAGAAFGVDERHQAQVVLGGDRGGAEAAHLAGGAGHEHVCHRSSHANPSVTARNGSSRGPMHTVDHFVGS